MANVTESTILNNSAAAGDDEELLEAVVDEAAYQPIYKVRGDSKLPISKMAGKLWGSRKDQAISRLEQRGTLENWDEAIRYYNNNQREGTTEDTRGRAYKRSRGGRTGYGGNETENIVFSNTSALVPSLYAKNPTVEITPNIRDDDQDDPAQDDDILRRQSKVAERLMNALAAKKGMPGLNLKPKARKCVVMCALTNVAWIEVGYTKKEVGSEAELQELNKLAEELGNAKDIKAIEEIEGKLEALDNTVDFLRPSGPWAKFRHPKSVLVDPDAENPDFSDAKWMMGEDYISTAFINAKYREKSDVENEWKDIYAPTHVQSANSASEVQDDINSFSLINDKTDYKKYGFKDQDSYRSACRTRVWYVWDSVTRRMYMYNDKCWTWPIWVWDDPYQLERFFPYIPLQFYTDPEDSYGTSETVMYLDQQDAINRINDEMAKIRERAFGTVFYNKNLVKDPEVIDAYLAGGETKKAIGLDLPPDIDMAKAFFAMLPPSANIQQLFNKEPLYAVINRMSSVDSVMRGEQFKTNTTNDAVNTYNSQNQTRLDEKIDAVEDFIGEIMWCSLQMCLQFMTPDEVGNVLGAKAASEWSNMDASEIQTKFSCRLVGGSTQKPTSQVKKQQALQMGQVLGQYANAGNGVVIIMLLKIMERAFDDFVITDEDWKALTDAISQQAQQQAEAPPQGAAPPAQAGAPPQGGMTPEQIVMAADQLLSQLPEQAISAIGTALAKGAPLAEIIPRVLQSLETSAAQPQQ